jgi:DNA helicase HerA-like ATPase
MNEDERKALEALRFDWAPVPDDVWHPSPFHVEGMHKGVVNDVRAAMADAKASKDGSPLGLVLVGRRGSGKTHLLGWVRQQIQDQGGYFFLVSLLDARGFWDSVLASMTAGLFRAVPGSDIQLRLFLRRLSSVISAPRSARRAIMGETELTPAALDEFLVSLSDYDRLVAHECDGTVRALALYVSSNVAHRDLADSYFGMEEIEPGERGQWRLRRKPRTAQEIVRELSRLLALTGPTVMAVDQIDTLISQSPVASHEGPQLDPSNPEDWAQLLVLEQIAHGLMALRQDTRRTLTIVACIPPSWMLIKTRATDTVRDRFRETAELLTIRDSAIAQCIIEKRFAHGFGQVGFSPPYPTWPIRPEAFGAAARFTPRQLLIVIDTHVRRCLLHDEVEELALLEEPSGGEPSAASPVSREVTDDVLERIDARFSDLKDEADVSAPLDPKREDTVVPGLLSAGLTAWIIERGLSDESFGQDGPPGTKPLLHARLRRTLDENLEDEAHWCFRAISGEHHGVAALNRIKRAVTAAGVEYGVPKRRLFFLRNGPWSGAKTLSVIEELKSKNTTTLALEESDLRTLAALQAIFKEAPDELQAWLTQRRPASGIQIFRQAMADLSDSPTPSAGAEPASLPDAAVQRRPTGESPDAVPMLTVGHDYTTREPVRLALESLRKHVAIFAGSGSGKTVLIRRLVEECALQGVSAIVLDPNNDLARLGDPWPAPPEAWGPGDADKAADYIAGTEVVVWTPRRETGRPLSFQPLPDFESVRDDPDEFNEAVESAVAALIPRARLDSKAAKAHLGLAVLRRTVDHYGRRGGSTLRGLIETLADLPDGVSELADADKIASDLAQTLTASVDNDPMFGGDSTPLDPAVLLTPSSGKRARISVISLIGLPSDNMRQSFVNQLEMALFAYIKKHPAGDRPLLGLFVMDEAQTLAPSGAMTACTQSTLALASQARKYGLGLAFATQSPKGLHNRIPGNAATQFYGLLNAPIQIDAAREMAKAKGGDVPDVSRLRSGEFYVAAEGEAPQKVRTPLCLSHHPKSPLTTEEVLERARAR